MLTSFISIHNPHSTSFDNLARIFVQREPLLQEIIDHLHQPQLVKKHFLLIGPKGIGKSHFIMMLYYHLQAWLPEKRYLVKLPEEVWGVESLAELFLNIVDTLINDCLPVEQRPKYQRRLEDIYQRQGDEVFRLCQEIIGARQLVILMENCQLLLKKSTLQRQLAELLAANPNYRIVATALEPFDDGSPLRQRFSSHS